MSSPPASLIPSTRRPLPLRCRPDLTCETAGYQGLNYVIVKDPVALEYFRLSVEQHYLLTCLDGDKSLEQLRDAFQKKFPTHRPQLGDIRQFVTDLHRKGLVYSERTGQAESLIERRQKQRRKAVVGAFQNVLYIKLPGWDPETLLKWLYPLVRRVFHPLPLMLVVLGILASWTHLLVNFSAFERGVPSFHQFFGWPNLLWLWVTMGLAKFIHEIAHGLTCKHFDGECHEIGMAFLVFSPCLYCDVSDSWILPDKWKRIFIACAGMLMEVAISAAALVCWWNTQPGLFHHLCLNVFLVTTITTVIFNANPLLKFDGYYILSDVLEIPNLRSKADQLLRNTFARVAFGIHLPQDPFLPDRGRFWFVLYSIAAAFYRWFIAFSIIFVLYEFLKPFGLHNLGLMLGFVSAGTIVAAMLWSVYRMLSSPRVQRMSYWRTSFSVCLLAGVVVGTLMIPLPLHMSAPFVIEPADVQHVYVATSGRLLKMHVKPGDSVKAGEVIAELENHEQVDELARLKTAYQLQEIEQRLRQLLDNKPGEQLARQALSSISERIQESQKRIQQLTIVAPCDGIVVAPPEVASASDDSLANDLGRWSGSTLDHRNQNCWLEAGTQLLSIAPKTNYKAVMIVDQEDRNDLWEQRPLALKIRAYPHRELDAQVAQFSDRHLELAPPQLSNKFGGPLPTATDGRGRERLSAPAYEAIALVGFEGPLRSGLQGEARFSVGTRTAGEWLWRSLQRTFHFRL